MGLANIILAGKEWLWPSVAAFVIALVLVFRSYSKVSAPQPLKLGCGLLKLVGIALFAACLLEPQWTGQRAKPGANYFAVMVDNSESMEIKDASGQPVDDLGTLKDGTKLDGMMGLRDYLGSYDGDFYNLLARKMIGYATGRSVLSTDRELIDTIRKQLQQGEGRFSEAVLSLVESRQFQFRRNEEESSEQSSP